MTSAQWRAAVKQGNVGALSRQNPDAIQRADGNVSFIASTATADRYGDTIDQSGWDTASFERNPVLLWAHSYSTPPVGKVGKLEKTTDALKASAIEFTPREIHALGADVGEMVKAGFLNTVSVGFLPKSWEERYSEDGAFKGYHFKEMELLELSVVPVPANPQALVQSRAFGQVIEGWVNETENDQLPPVTKAWGDQLRAWLKAGSDAAEAIKADVDDDSFAEMLSALKAIQANTAETKNLLSAMVAVLKASKGIPPAVVSPESASTTFTLAEALLMFTK